MATLCPVCPHCNQPINDAPDAPARAAKTRGPVFLAPDEIRALTREALYAYRKRTAAHDDAAFYLRHLAAVDAAGGASPARTDAAAVAAELLAALKGRASRPADSATLYALKLQTRPNPARPFRFAVDRARETAAKLHENAERLREDPTRADQFARQYDAARESYETARELAARYGLPA